MSMPVSLRELIDELDAPVEDWHAFLNRRTGELFGASDETVSAWEADDNDSPDWLNEEVAKMEEVQNSEEWLELPSKFDIDEYDIMRGFCGSLDDHALAADLLDTIGGRGTFARFKNM